MRNSFPPEHRSILWRIFFAGVLLLLGHPLSRIRHLVAAILLCSPLHAAELMGVKFDNSAPIPYSINLGNWSSSPNRDLILQGIQNAFAKISGHPQLNVDFDYRGITTALPGRDGISVVYLDHNRTYAPGAGATFNMEGSGGFRIAADIALNGNTHASTPLTNLYALTLHELCHFLGLNHSSTGTDSAVYPDTVNLELSPDDVSGLAFLYPNPANPLSAVTGTVSGTITTSNGQLLNPRIVAYDDSKPQPRVITTIADNNGNFTLTGLPPGNYRFFAESAGRAFKHSFLGGAAVLPVAAGGAIPNLNFLVQDYGVEIQREAPLGRSLRQSSSGKIFTTDLDGGSVWISDESSGEILSVVATDADDLAFSPDERTLYTVSQATREMSAWNVDPSLNGYPPLLFKVSGLPSQPISIELRDHETAYVACNGGLAVAAVDLVQRSIKAVISTGMYCQNLTLSDDRTRLWAGQYSPSFKIVEIDIDPASSTFHTILRNFPAGSDGAYLVRKIPGQEIVAQGTRSGIDFRNSISGELISRLPTGRFTPSLSLSRDGRFLFAIGNDDPALRNAELWVIDVSTRTIVERMMLGADFLHAGVPDDDGVLFVTGQSGIARVSPFILRTRPSFQLPPAIQRVAVAGQFELPVISDVPAWSATSSAPWLVIEEVAADMSEASVRYRLEPNSTGHARRATLTINGHPLTIYQNRAYTRPRFAGPDAAYGLVGQAFRWVPEGFLPGGAFSAAGLPAGLVMDPSTGEITGTRSSTGTHQVAIHFFNATGSGRKNLKVVFSTVARPELILTRMKFPADLGTGVNYDWTVRNIGTAPLTVDSRFARYYVTSPARGTSGSIYANAFVKTFRLPPGESHTEREYHYGTIPPATTHPFVSIVVDSAGFITEYDETNNSLSSPREGWDYDLWKYHSRFSAAQAADPATSSESSDPDGDGIGNLMEYAFGLDPLSSDARSAAGDPAVDVAGLGFAEIQLRLPEDPRSDLDYIVESSPSLSGPWDTVNTYRADGTWLDPSAVFDQGDNGLHRYWSVTSSYLISASRTGFFRIRVEKSPAP